MKTQTFAFKKLREARESKSLSQEEMILRLYDKGFQISRQTLTNYESGTTDPQVKDLIVIAEVLGKDVGYFFA